MREQTDLGEAVFAALDPAIDDRDKVGSGMLTLSGSSTYAGATAVNAGTLQAGAVNAFSPSSALTVATGAILALNSSNQTIGSLAGAGSVTLGSATLTTGNDNTSTTFSGAISGTGGLTKIGAGTLTLSGSNSYSGGTALNAGTVAASADNNLGNSSGSLAFGSGTLQFLSGFTSNRAVTLNSGGGTFDTNGNSATLAGTLSGTGGLSKIGSGTLTLAGNNSYSGATAINAGRARDMAARTAPAAIRLWWGATILPRARRAARPGSTITSLATA